MADDESLSKSTILGMVAMAVAVFVVANDFTALSVALPAIEKTFSTSVNTSQWVINGYAMVFGVAIVTGGRLADIFAAGASFSSVRLSSQPSRCWADLHPIFGCCSPAGSLWASAAR
ncbi:MAG: hypothetical protein ACTSYK_07510 [Alphaproteobacteria bacterium]